jgi:1-acyl-sn-glycerol-3-phosphate acyltransferase
VLLQRTGAPALPVRIAGSFEAWPRGRRWPRPRRLTITFGTPIAADELRRRGTGASDAERIADGLRAAVTALPAD